MIQVGSRVRLLAADYKNNVPSGSYGFVVEVLDSKTFLVDIDGPMMKCILVDNRWQDKLEEIHI